MFRWVIQINTSRPSDYFHVDHSPSRYSNVIQLYDLLVDFDIIPYS